MTRAIAEQVFGTHVGAVSKYVDILATIGVERGLIGPRETHRLWDRHVLNSVAMAALIDEGADLVDVGSGAGLPGLPLAVLRPDLQVTLLEPLLRRATFLTEAVAALGLEGRVQVVRGRAEDQRRTYAVVTARALAPLSRLVTWCAPLRRQPGGVILALKGRTAADEIAAAAPELARTRLRADQLSMRAHPEAEATTIVHLSSADS